jgi:hypothetical protein
VAILGLGITSPDILPFLCGCEYVKAEVNLASFEKKERMKGTAPFYQFSFSTVLCIGN